MKQANTILMKWNKKQLIVVWVATTLLIVTVPFFILNLKEKNYVISRYEHSIRKYNSSPDSIDALRLQGFFQERAKLIAMYGSIIFVLFSFAGLLIYTLRGKKK